MYACVDCDWRRKKGQLDLVAQAVSAMKDSQQYELSNVGSSKEIAPGMALVSIETLAKLQSSVCENCGESKICGDIKT